MWRARICGGRLQVQGQGRGQGQREHMAGQGQQAAAGLTDLVEKYRRGRVVPCHAKESPHHLLARRVRERRHKKAMQS